MQEQEEVKTEIYNEHAVLIGLITPEQNEEKENEYINELAFLCETAGAYPQKKFFQKQDYPNPGTFVGPGKLQEIADYIKSVDDDPEQRIGLAIFDRICKGWSLPFAMLIYCRLILPPSNHRMRPAMPMLSLLV